MPTERALGLAVGSRRLVAALVPTEDPEDATCSSTKFTGTAQAAVREARKLVAKHGAGRFTAVGAAVPGQVDHKRGIVVFGPHLVSKGHSWKEVGLGAMLEEEFGAPAVVENDVNAMAFGEQRIAFADIDAMLVVKVGTGIGAGIICGGEVYRGADGAAGDIGHTQVTVEGESAPPLCHCGNSGCVEARAGGWALVRDLRAAGHEVTTVDDAVALVRCGDTTAVGLVRRAGRLLGGAIAHAVSLLNPRAVVLTGQLAACEEQLMAGIREMVYSRSLPLATSRIRIARSRLGPRGGVIGTSLLLADTVFAPERINRMLA
jgi:predicted NBD/HSP70 family sugar kinase